ncbi:MAG: IS200/IS605 family transposase [Chitinophagaceae bacterium]|nr:IS200/IS605 family transposase [Chitinophagaceae bacterium]
MPNTYSQLYIQIVFAVKGRQAFINESFREELQKYISGIIAEKKQKLYAIYCMPDHTHILVSIKPDIAISDLVRDIKANSSSFIKEKGFIKDFSWQTGFGAFSYSKSQSLHVVDYILNQPLHHKKKIFKEEYTDFLNKFEIDFKEEYLFEFYD